MFEFRKKNINIYLETLAASGFAFSELLVSKKEQSQIADSIGAILAKEFKIGSKNISKYEEIGKDFFSFLKNELKILEEA